MDQPAHPILIPPRAPSIVRAQDIIRSRQDFKWLLPSADIIDFTELDFSAQEKAVATYLQFYNEGQSYSKSPEIDKDWRQRMYDRRRKDYYWAALCGNDPALMHRLMIRGDWNERLHQTNLLVISNPDISNNFLEVELTRKHSVRYDYYHQRSGCNANFFVLPHDILCGLKPKARKPMVHGISKNMFLTTHDDGHDILGNIDSNEEYLRAMTAELFGQMPAKFRRSTVDRAINCLSLLDQQRSFADNTNTKEQIAFWHGSFVYVMQYLFEFQDPVLEGFVKKLQDQSRASSITTYSHYLSDLLNKIQSQLDRDEPEIIHSADQQKTALAFMRGHIRSIPEVQGSLVRRTSFLATGPANNTTFRPHRIQKKIPPLDLKTLFGNQMNLANLGSGIVWRRRWTPHHQSNEV